MAHVFEGQPDGRQADAAIAVSRFRPKYRALSDDEKALHDALKAKAVELEELYAKVKPGRYNALAITSLEQSRKLSVLTRSRIAPMIVVRDISWGILPLVAGLFVLVEALQNLRHTFSDFVARHAGFLDQRESDVVKDGHRVE